MAHQDELLEGFCRGCLVKYDDPTDLLHYTEKNRRLFVYSTGIQVKRTDAFTFQICKDCNVNMKLSCIFKKQCRSSDRRFKSYLRLKDLGDAIDLATFVKNTDDTVKFPLLSGNSTPANQKVREDDNESTCTSIRNFMSDILQGEEMPDTEARIIKEVIEEEADLLDDSLESHWLQDDASMSTDFRLDFSFSPFTTPHSTNAENRNVPNKQITPKLPNRNNHAKRVFQQLPTMHYDQDDNAVTVKSSNKCYGRDSQIDLDNSMEKTTFQNEDTMNDILESEDYLRHTSANNMPVRNLDLNAFATEYEISRKNTKEDDVGLSLFQNKSEDGRDLTTNHLITKSVDINTFEAVCGSNRKTSDHESVSSINSDTFTKDKSKVYRNTENELDVAVNSINLNTFETESETNSQTLNDNIEDMSIDSNTFETESEANRRATNELDVAISNMELSTFTTESKFTIEIVEEKVTETTVNRNVVKTESEGGIKITDGAKISLASFDLNAFGVGTKDDTQITDIQKAVKSVGVNNFSLKSGEEKHANDFLEEVIDDCNEPQQDPLFEECVDKNMSDIPIDKNLLVPLKDETNKTVFSLDDLLVSPARDVIATVLAQPKGASTPTINNILFGVKLDDSNYGEVEDNVDLDEIVQEAAKDLNVEGINKPDELPLVLKYDLENCECKQCKKKFKSLKSLKIHLTKVHKIKFPKPKPNYKPKTCPHCGITITDSGNYCRHLETHQKKRDGPFKCEICTVLFETEIKLRMHMKVHNLGSYQRLKTDDKKESGKKYVCETCGAMFRTHSNLSMHKRRHTTAYAHKCEVCNKGFHRVVDMQVHKRRHTGERPFACPQCKNAYITKYHLVVHMRKHTEEKPYQCDYCSSKFPVKQTLVEHIRESRSCIKIRKELEKNKGADILKCSHCLLRFPNQKKFTKHQCKKLVVDMGIPVVLTEENLQDMPVVIA